jgi:hypothetical protein
MDVWCYTASPKLSQIMTNHNFIFMNFEIFNLDWISNLNPMFVPFIGILIISLNFIKLDFMK